MVLQSGAAGGSSPNKAASKQAAAAAAAARQRRSLSLAVVLERARSRLQVRLERYSAVSLRYDGCCMRQAPVLLGYITACH
jgi:hypothetical protein